MSKFKVGDKVKVIKKSTKCGPCSDCHVFIGKIGIVKESPDFGGVPVHQFPGMKIWCSGFSEDCLEKVVTEWDE